MNMDKKIIGENAGIIWRTLHNNKMSWEELLKNTASSRWNWQAASAGLRERTRYSYIPIMGLSILKSIKNVTFDCEAWLEKHCTHVM